MSSEWTCTNCHTWTMSEAGPHGWCVTCEAGSTGVQFRKPAFTPNEEQRSRTPSVTIARVPKGRQLRSHCKNGHALSGTNIYVDSEGKRRCRSCRLDRQRGYRDRQRFTPESVDVTVSIEVSCRICGKPFLGVVTKGPDWLPVHPVCQAAEVAHGVA